MKTVNVGELTIRPSLKKTVKDIHPAIGVVDGTAYVGVWLPCEISGKKEGDVAYKDLLFLVTDKRELILANDEVFRNKGLNWRLAYKPIHFSNRWHLQHIQAYLEGATVDPSIVLGNLIESWQKYMELPSEAEYLYHALWDLGTYFYHLFNCFPYHYIGGVKRSGKTKDLMLHYCLAFNAIFSNNMSTASIYRLIQNARTTLLIDETEKLSYKGQMSERTLEFRSILLSGYKKGGRAYRVEKTRKEMLQPQAFDVYSPKAMANIRGLEDVMEDRCKTTILKRSRNAKIVNLEIDEESEEWVNLRNQLYVFFLTYWKEIKEIYDKIASFSELNEFNELVNIKIDTLFSKEDLELLVGRELELWKAILALAVFFQRKGVSISKFTSSPSSLCSSVLSLAIVDAKQRLVENVTETGEIILLQILTKLVNEDNYYPVKTLKESMAEAFDEEQKWLTTRWIGSALRRLGFKEKRRVGTGYQYLLRKKDVVDLANRMALTLTPIEKKPRSFPFKIEDISKIEELTTDVQDKCVVCKTQGQMKYQLTLQDGSWNMLCEICGKELKRMHKQQLGKVKDNVKLLLQTLVEMERETGIVEKTVFLKEIETKLDITTDTAKRLLSLLLREGEIFSPKEGYLKKS